MVEGWFGGTHVTCGTCIRHAAPTWVYNLLQQPTTRYKNNGILDSGKCATVSSPRSSHKAQIARIGRDRHPIINFALAKDKLRIHLGSENSTRT